MTLTQWGFAIFGSLVTAVIAGEFGSKERTADGRPRFNPVCAVVVFVSTMGTAYLAAIS
ncbi:hypothetical protein [Thermomonas sp.]|uniref:hypothetical protein n=1 Tax=Thermomonas sp. TaxID=1971895 RepID=UPI0035B4B8AC